MGVAQVVAGVRRLLGTAALGVTLAGCTFSDLGPGAAGADRASRGQEFQAAARIGGWTVRVSVESTSVGRLAVSIGPARPVRDAGGHGWIEHNLILENVGRRTLQLTGTRSSAAFIGPAGHRRRLLASAGLCGYTPEGRGFRFTLMCLMMLDATDLKAGASQVGTITLTKELRGMEPLLAGKYVFDFRFRTERQARAVGTDKEAALKIVYEIESAQRL